MNLSDAFQFWGHGLDDYEFATHLGADAKITIHVAHRIGAIITTLYLSALFIFLISKAQVSSFSKKVAAGGLLILATQVGLGIGNVVLDLPLAVAVAHNGVAAILMMSLILLTVSLSQGAKNHD